MTGALALLGGILLVVSVIGIWDWLAERQHRRAHKPGRSS